jgi:hypothetical protein
MVKRKRGRNKQRESGQYGEESFESHTSHYCETIDAAEYKEGHAVPLCVRQLAVPAPFTIQDRWTIGDYVLLNHQHRTCTAAISNYDNDSAGGCSDDLVKILAEVKNQNVGGSVNDKAFRSLTKAKGAIHRVGLTHCWLVLLGIEWRFALQNYYDELVDTAAGIQQDVKSAGYPDIVCRVIRGPLEVAQAIREFYTGQEMYGKI